MRIGPAGVRSENQPRQRSTDTSEEVRGFRAQPLLATAIVLESMWFSSGPAPANLRPLIPPRTNGGYWMTCRECFWQFPVLTSCTRRRRDRSFCPPRRHLSHTLWLRRVFRGSLSRKIRSNCRTRGGERRASRSSCRKAHARRKMRHGRPTAGLGKEC